MEESGYAFIIMVKGIKDFVSGILGKEKRNWTYQIRDFGIYGKTVRTFIYPSAPGSVMYLFITAPSKRPVNGLVSKKKYARCRSILRSTEKKNRNSARCSISIFICIMIKKAVISVMRNQGWTSSRLSLTCTDTLQSSLLRRRTLRK